MHFLPERSRLRDDLRISSGCSDRVDLSDILQY